MTSRRPPPRTRGSKRALPAPSRPRTPSKAVPGRPNRSTHATGPGPRQKTKRRLFVIGAGASYAAGLPDASRLPVQVFGYTGGAPWEVVRNRPTQAYFKPLNAVLLSVLRELSTGGPQDRWPMDTVFERFSQLIRDDPKRFGVAFGQLFEATAQLLYHRSQTGASSEAYRRFVRAVTGDDVILSFNWDVCLEIAMKHAASPLQRSLRPHPGAGPWLLKPNGSIDHLIVNTSKAGKGSRRDGARDSQSWWTRFRFLDRLHVTAPSPPAVRAAASSRYELARLRTYDLAGYRVRIGSGALLSIGEDAIEEDASDVGPFALTHLLPEYPSIHLIAPATPPALSRWYLDAIASAVAPVAAGFTSIYVIGYSFPIYDLPAIRLLRNIVRASGGPPAHIVNPAAARLPRQALQFIFGNSPLQLHACGFEVFDWAP